MNFCRRRSVFLGLLVASAFVAAAGCSSGGEKKKVRYVGDSGAGGEAGDAEPGAAGVPAGGAAGSAVAPSEAGQGGEAAGAAGAAGAPSIEMGGANTAGGGGASAAGGSAGSAATCQPVGDATNLSLTVGTVGQKVCRGAAVLNTFDSDTTDSTFTCCGASDTGYSVDVSGVSTADGAGTASLVVPVAAPLGAQSVTLTCASGPVIHTFDVIVTDALAPVVTGADSAIFSGDQLHITGLNLSGVTTVTAVPTGVGAITANGNCFFIPDNVSDTELSCSFDGIAPGDYRIVVEEDDCGYAVNAPTLTIKPPTL